jgi:hypothetical protein
MEKLKNHLERLRCDFNLITQSKIQAKLFGAINESGSPDELTSTGNGLEVSVDSDRIVTE